MRAYWWIGLLATAVVSGCGDNDIPGPGGPGNTPDAPPGTQPDAAPIDAPPDGPDPVLPGDPVEGSWLGGFSLPGASGQGARVEEVAIAGDGTVVIAGIFENVSGVPARNLARWTGTDWVALGDGLPGWVRAAGFDAGGGLWAATTSDDVTSATLARWDGTTWMTTAPLDGAIRDLAFIPDGVVAAGDFTGSVKVYRPSLGVWIDVVRSIEGAASVVASRAPDPGFCVAGSFTEIDNTPVENTACFDGALWSAWGAGLPGGVSVLARSPGGTWYAGGTLTYTIDNQGNYEAGIAVLVGNRWGPFEGGIDNGFINEVRAIAFAGDDVLIGGQFLSAGASDVPARHLARWSPTAGWSQLGGGLVNQGGVFLPSLTGGHDLAVAADGTIWVGGLYTTASGVPATNISTLSTTGEASALVGPHTVLGVGGFVDGLAVDADGTLYAGGMFEAAGQTTVHNIAALTGQAWADLGGGVPGIVRDVAVRSSGAIAIAGELVVDGAGAAYAEWNGTAWTMPGGRVDGVGFAIEEDADGTLWLGGDLVAAGGTPVSNLAHLASDSWAAAGAFDGRVLSIAVDGSRVVVGGMFGTVDALPARGVVVWDGTAYTAPGGGLDDTSGYVMAVAVSPSLGIVIGGEFDSVGGGSAHDLARWDGTAWSDLGTEFDGTVFTLVTGLATHGDGVFATGVFQDIGTAPASNLAWYDGAAWHGLGAGLGDLGEALVVAGDVLWVGGPFTTAGGVPASGLAAWDFRRK